MTEKEYTYLVAYDLQGKDLDKYDDIKKYLENKNGISLQKSVWIIKSSTEYEEIPLDLKTCIPESKILMVHLAKNLDDLIL